MAGLDLTAPRATARQMMTDACTIRVRSDPAEATVDPVTFHVVYDSDDPVAAVYSGPCFVGIGAQSQARIAEAPVERSTFVIGIPWDAAVPPAGAVATIDSVGPTGDSSLIGEELVVTGVVQLSFLVYRALTAEHRRPSGPVPGILNG